jgi:hypothetical protein
MFYAYQKKGFVPTPGWLGPCLLAVVVVMRWEENERQPLSYGGPSQTLTSTLSIISRLLLWNS